MNQPEANQSPNADAGRGLSEGLGPLPEAAGLVAHEGGFRREPWVTDEPAYSAEQMREYAEHAVARERQRTMFARRPGLWALRAREVLELIAAPMRPDGTWNRDREACRQMAAEALGRYED